MKRARILPWIVLLAFAARPLSAELLVSGTAELNAGVFINTEELVESSLDQQLILSPSLSAWNDTFDFSFSGSIGVERPLEQLNFDVNELLVTVYPFDFMQISAGRFAYLPGTAEFLSSTNYFSRTDYEKLLAGTVSETGVPNDLLQLGFFVSDYYFKFTTALFRPEMLLPPVSSPWFPGKDIPTEVEITVILTKTTLHLDEIYYVEPEPSEFSFDEVSFSPEIGATFGGIDVSLMYYRGFDNSPLTQLSFKTSGLYESDPYDIELTPYYRWIDAIGANVATTISSLRLWLDASYTFEKGILSNRVSYSTRNTPVVFYPYLEYTLGASYEFYDPSIFALLEVRNSHIIGGEDHLLEPTLGSALTGGLNFSFFDSRLSLYLFGLLSLADNSTALVTRLSYDPVDDLRFQLTFPVFSGADDTELGQFTKNTYLAANLEWRY
jgi:hypothetical protein